MMKAEGSNVACARKEGKARGEGTVPGGISPILQKKVVQSFVSGGPWSVHAGLVSSKRGSVSRTCIDRSGNYLDCAVSRIVRRRAGSVKSMWECVQEIDVVFQ
jgi:hypothetical protein